MDEQVEKHAHVEAHKIRLCIATCESALAFQPWQLRYHHSELLGSLLEWLLASYPALILVDKPPHNLQPAEYLEGRLWFSNCGRGHIEVELPSR